MSPGLSVLLDVALKGTVVLIIALLAALALRRASAAARHLLWALTVVVLLALPLLSVLLPRWHLPFNSPWSASVPPQDSEERGAVSITDDQGVLVPHPRHLMHGGPVRPKAVLVATSGQAPPGALRRQPVPAPGQAEPQVASSDPWAWILIAWTAGAALSLTWILGGCVSLALLRRKSRPLTEGAAADLLGELAQSLGIRRHVRLLESERRAMPMTWGLLRPIVLLPREAAAWSAERLRLVLLHELGHVGRRDCLTQLLAHVVRGLYWFHPLAWIAVARLKAEQEAACDDIVLRTGAGAADYAEHLLSVTAGLPASYFASPVALAMARASKLRRRLVALLDDGRNRRPLRRGALAAALLAAVLVLPLAGADFAPAPGAPAQEAAPAQGEKKKPAQPVPPLQKIDEVRKKLLDAHVTKLDEARLAEDAIKGMLQALKDPYSVYMSPEELAHGEAQFKGALTGIGVQLKMQEGRIIVQTPLEGSPALKAGLRPGDIIESIDGQATAGMDLPSAVKRIIGPSGKEVKLKIVHHDGVVEDVGIVRAEVRFPSVQGFRRDDMGRWVYLLDDQHKVGYVQVGQVGVRTAAELRAVLEGLQKAGLKGLLLDLRSCPGGFLDQAIEVCRLFLPKGKILTMRGPGKEEKSFMADGTGYLGDFPLVLLVNEQTASAAEIVAGALADHKRAVLLGTRTYGKGSVQTLMRLDGGGALRLTTAHHYLPGGRNIARRPGEKTWGVDPSDGFYLPLTKEQTEALQRDASRRNLVGLKKEDQPMWKTRLTPRVLEEEHADPQLAAALRTMVARLTGGEFIKVGRSTAVLQEHALQLEELRRRREALQQDLQKLEKEMSDLQKESGKR